MSLIQNAYKKFVAALLCVCSIVGLTFGISRLSKKGNIAVISGEDGPTAYFFAGKISPCSILTKIASGAAIIAFAAVFLLSIVKRFSRKESI